MALVNYSSSSSCPDSDDEEPKAKQPKKSTKQKDATLQTKSLQLPKATAQLGSSKSKDSPEALDDHEEHDGRIRSFQHERGNWATFVYIPVDACLMDDIQELCQTALEEIVPLKFCTDLHISLSRTVVLQYHLIDSFIKSLEQEFETCNRLSICLRNLKIYANEEKTRTFIGFQIDELYAKSLYKLMSKVDTVMSEYRLPLFYENPSFHISFLWCLGDQVETLNANFKQLEIILDNLNISDDFSFVINEVHCKSGNKQFFFMLK